LFILMLILSSATINNNKTIRLINSKAQEAFFRPVSGASEIPAQYNDHNGLKPANVITNRTNKKTASIVLQDTLPAKDDRIFTSVEHVPGFPGGIQAFGRYLQTNMHYPADSREKGIHGRVIVSFVVEKDGSLSNIRIARGVADDLDREALRVIKASPKWTPGVQNGKLVRVAYSVPIAFTLEDQSKPKPTADVTIDENQPRLTTPIVLRSDTGNSTVLVTGNAKPLYILDGKEITSLMTINPSDIESIVVLKDKSAIALYGSKGANGVVVIKTKGSKLQLKK